jgi:hypothetical protein
MQKEEREKKTKKKKKKKSLYGHFECSSLMSVFVGFLKIK